MTGPEARYADKRLSDAPSRSIPARYVLAAATESGAPAFSLWLLPGIQTDPAEVAVVPPTMSDFSQRTAFSPSSAPTSAAVMPAAPAPTTRRSVSKSHRRLSDCNDIALSQRQARIEHWMVDKSTDILNFTTDRAGRGISIGF